MLIALRLVSVAYVAVIAVTAFTFFLVQPPWPEPAAEYYAWFTSQPRSSLLKPLPYVGLSLMALSWLSAIALMLNQRWARWPFAGVIAAVLALNIVAVAGDQLPQIISVVDSALNEASSVLAGLLLGLSFYPEKPGSESKS